MAAIAELAKFVNSISNIPVIFIGGAGENEHFYELLSETNIDAVAAANYFQFSDQSTYLTKKYLFEKNLNFREPRIFKIL